MKALTLIFIKNLIWTISVLGIQKAKFVWKFTILKKINKFLSYQKNRIK